MARKSVANYGIDAPQVIRNLLVIGIILMLIFIFLPIDAFLPWSAIIVKTVFWPAVCLILSGLMMILYAKVGKFRQRNRILNAHVWQGDEIVLDVGTGAGLLMIGAAKKLTTGTAYGLDIFTKRDLSGNTMGKTKRNAELEGVADKIKIVEKNILKTDFPDAMFDVVVSNLCIHNIAGKRQREHACEEVVRLMKPGATAIISDFIHTGDYRNIFKKLGLEVKRKGPFILDTFPPLTIVIAKKK